MADLRARIGEALLLGGLLIFVWPQPAHAYIDPGAGLFLLQAIGSGIAGAVFLMRRRLGSGVRKFWRRRAAAEESQTDTAGEPPPDRGAPSPL